MRTYTRSIKCNQCGNELWDVIGDYAECSNCGNRRPYQTRKTRVTGNPKPSQQKAIDKIKRFFQNFNNELHAFTVTATDYGTFWVSVDTNDPVSDIWRNRGGLFHIGKRGKIDLHQINDLASAERKAEKKDFYADMLGCHIK